MAKNILFISYFTGVDANCPAEWADDRLRSIAFFRESVIVLTNYGTKLENTDLTRIVRAPSLSTDDFLHELKLRGGMKAIPGFGKYFLLVFVFLFGGLLRLLTKVLTRGGSGGKWSWLICAIPSGLWLGLRNRIDIIYCTGGPPSAYIVGILVALLTKAPLKIEFQDPLVGAEINRSKYKQTIVRFIERIIIKQANTCFYVTKKAALDSKKRNLDMQTKIVCNYPGSWNFKLDNYANLDISDKPITILHLGTLYGSRNLDKFFVALDEMYLEKTIKSSVVKIINLGSVYTSNVSEYIKRSDFILLAERTRIEALKIAKRASFLLLVQHDDDRSVETIPYKIYDYINLNIPIIHLVKNPEIKAFFSKNPNLVANCSNVKEIKAALSAAMTLYMSPNYKNIKYSDCSDVYIDINKQISNIIY